MEVAHPHVNGICASGSVNEAHPALSLSGNRTDDQTTMTNQSPLCDIEDGSLPIWKGAAY